MKKFMQMLAMLALGAIMTGCASVDMASSEKDQQAKQFKAKADKASIYVYRNESMGAAIKMPVLLNNQHAGTTAAKTYMVLDVPAGKHTLISKTENDSVLNMAVEAGKNYYVWQEVKMGAWSARSQLQQVDEAKGKADVLECSLIAQPELK